MTCGVTSRAADKYNGDVVMALLGVPIKGATDTDNATSALLNITVALEKKDFGLSPCVGITTGILVAGNLPARLECLTRPYNVSNIVSGASRDDEPNLHDGSSTSSALLVSRSEFAFSNHWVSEAS